MEQAQHRLWVVSDEFPEAAASIGRAGEDVIVVHVDRGPNRIKFWEDDLEELPPPGEALTVGLPPPSIRPSSWKGVRFNAVSPSDVEEKLHRRK